MELMSCVCPNCGSTLTFEEGKKLSFCNYCGGQIALDDNSQKVVFEDVAGTKRIELDEKIYFSQEQHKRDEAEYIAEQQRQNRIAIEKAQKKYDIWKLIVVSTYVVYAVLNLIVQTVGSFHSFMIMMIIGIVSPIFLSGFRPRPGGKIKMWFIFTLLFFILFFVSGFAAKALQEYFYSEGML